MLQEHKLSSTSVGALLAKALMFRTSIQCFSEGAAIVRKNLQKGKKKTLTHINPPHVPEQQESELKTYLIKLFRATETQATGVAPHFHHHNCGRSSAFSLRRTETLSDFRGKLWKRSCRVSYHDADRKAKQNKHQNSS